MVHLKCKRMNLAHARVRNSSENPFCRIPFAARRKKIAADSPTRSEGARQLSTHYYRSQLHQRASRHNPSDPMPLTQPNNPLHGLTLETILTRLADAIGWEAMGAEVPIRCFSSDPSIPSSLKFLRKTPWARAKVEALYLRTAGRKSGVE